MNFSKIDLPNRKLLSEKPVLAGSPYLEVGYVFAPYVPLITTPITYSEEDLTPKKGILTRYKNKKVNESFYSSVPIHSLIK